MAERIYPVVAWRGRTPVISDGYSAEETVTHREHHGADIMFRRLPTDAAEFPVDSKNGSKLYVMGNDVDVVAWSSGKLWSAGYSETYGHYVVIDHGPEPYATFYQHLSALAVPKKSAGGGGQTIRAGEKLGTVGGAPTGYGLKHLHFEVWEGGAASSHTDPAPFLQNARVISGGSSWLKLGALLASLLALVGFTRKGGGTA